MLSYLLWKYDFCFVKLNISVLSNINYRILIPQAHEKDYILESNQKIFFSAFSQEQQCLTTLLSPCKFFACMYCTVCQGIHIHA